MSILVHKVGINKTLGQKSNYMEGGSSLPRTDSTGWRDSLTGEWQAGTGFSGAGDIWGNQVSGGRDLRAYNSMVCNSSSTPHHLIFDGIDDYIWNTSTGYGGNPFTVDLSADFTIGSWVRSASNGTSYAAFVGTGTSSGGYLYSYFQNGQWTVTDGNNSAVTTGSAANKMMADNTWHYVSMSHDRSEGYVYIYVDGKYGSSFAPSYSDSEGATRSDGAHWNGSFNLGFGHGLRHSSSFITDDSSAEAAFLYVWDRYWGASQHRHMFLGQSGAGGINSILPEFGAPRTDT